MTMISRGAPVFAPIDVRPAAVDTGPDDPNPESGSGDQVGGAVDIIATLRKLLRQRRAKSRPALDRAREAVNRLYPTGVPDQATEPNAKLCRRIAEKLKEAGLSGVSDDTILRAAGRRK